MEKNRFGVLPDGVLPGQLDDDVEWLREKTGAVSGEQDVRGHRWPERPHEYGRKPCAAGNAASEAGLNLAGGGAIADKPDPQGLPARRHGRRVYHALSDERRRYHSAERGGWAVDKIRINTFGRSALHELAVSEGIYRAEDLEVEHAVTQSSKAQMQELIDGVWDVVHTNADNVFFWNEDNGADLLIVLASPGEPGQDFVVRPEIQTYEDLRGKPLAADAAESGYATPLRLLLRQAGLTQEGSDFTYLQVGSTQHRIDAMKDGRAYGAMVGSNQSASLAAEGFRVLDSINRLYTHYAGAAAVRRQWAEEQSAVLIRYLRSVILSTRRGASGGRGAEGFDWAGLEEMMQMRRDLGMLRGAVDPHRFADDSYYNRAVDSLTTSSQPVS